MDAPIDESAPTRWHGTRAGRPFGNESRGRMERIANIRRVEGKTGNVRSSLSRAFSREAGGGVKRRRGGRNRENQNKRMSEKKREDEGVRGKERNI